MNYIYYIVRLKDNFCMDGTTINREFAGRIDKITDDSIWFKLNGGQALVIVPYAEISWMAPAKMLWKYYGEGDNYD